MTIPLEYDNGINIQCRFRWNKEIVEGIVLDTVKEQLARRQSSDLINRNFLKMLTSLCGLTEVCISTM